MNRSNLTYLRKQSQQDEILIMQGKAFIELIRSIISDYGHYSHGSYSVDIDSLTLADKKLLLSHILEASDYEWACQNPVRTEVIFDENRKALDRLISDEADQIFRDEMEEHGCVARSHYDNGERYWVRR